MMQRRGFLSAVLVCTGFVIGSAACGSESDTLAGIRRACAFELACAPGAMAMSGGTCIQQGIAALDRATMQSAEVSFRLQCARNSNSCATFQSCILRNHAATYCQMNPGETCDGTVLVNCAPNAAMQNPPPLPVQTVDCAGGGLQCHAGTNGGGTSHAICTNGASCNMSDMPTCNGSQVLSCDPQLMVQNVNDCAASGDTCESVSVDLGFGMMTNVAQCVPSTMPCTIAANAPNNPTCDGTTLVECVPLPLSRPAMDGSRQGRQRRTDCTNALIQGTCVTVGDGTTNATSMCTPSDNHCAPDSPDRCDGNSVQYCVDGHYESTDCGSLGLRHCVQVTWNRAACVQSMN